MELNSFLYSSGVWLILEEYKGEVKGRRQLLFILEEWQWGGGMFDEDSHDRHDPCSCGLQGLDVGGRNVSASVWFWGPKVFSQYSFWEEKHNPSKHVQVVTTLLFACRHRLQLKPH